MTCKRFPPASRRYFFPAGRNESIALRPKGKICIQGRVKIMHAGLKAKYVYRPGGRNCGLARGRNLHSKVSFMEKETATLRVASEKGISLTLTSKYLFGFREVFPGGDLLPVDKPSTGSGTGGFDG
jgi:hypothetical protein